MEINVRIFEITKYNNDNIQFVNEEFNMNPVKKIKRIFYMSFYRKIHPVEYARKVGVNFKNGGVPVSIFMEI